MHQMCRKKHSSDFSNDKKRKDGKFPQCKACCQARHRAWRDKNRAKLPEKRRIYREKNLDQIIERDRKYYEANKERVCARIRNYCKENSELVSQQRKRHRELNRERILERKRSYHARNRARLNERSRIYQKANRAKRRAYWHKYKHRPDVRLNKALRSVLSEFCRRAKQSKVGSTSALLGYTPEQLRQRMECQFKSGMSWENHGEWHIDHKIPVSRFVERGEIRAHIVNALSNLQPLWAEDNMSKKNRWAG